MKLNVSMKRILSFLMALVMVLGMLPHGGLHIHAHAAEAVTMTGGEVLYLKPNSNWLVDNARFAAYFFGSNGNGWTSMEPVPHNEGYYQLTVPEGEWTNVIFCRMNPSKIENNWDNKWNQTADLCYDGVNNLFTVPDGYWDGASTGWSTWSLAENHSYENGICTICGSAELFTIIFYSSYRLDMAEELDRVTAPAGSDISAEADAIGEAYAATDPGYRYDGWLDVATWDKVDMTSTPARNVSVFVDIGFKYFPLYYYANGQLYHTSEACYTNGYKYKEPKVKPTREGYSFTGWKYYLSYDGETGEFSQEYTDDTMTNAPLYANAQWECLHGTTRYDANEDGLTHTLVCSTCGEAMGEAEAHSTGLPEDKPGSCAAPVYCSVCNGYYGEMDPVNHVGPFTPVYEWPEEPSDYVEVCAEMHCKCGAVVDYIYREAELAEEIPAVDCATPGTMTYVVTFEYAGVNHTYTHTYTVTGDVHTAMDENGFCTCGGYEAAHYNEESDVYEIGNAGQLYWYAQELNENNSEIHVKLVADIQIPENAPNWTPINSSYAYFDGNCKTISGLKCVGGEETYVGLFGNEVWWYEISNLHITDSYFEGSQYVGAVVAALGNGGSVTNCYVTDTTVTGGGYSIGGLVGSLSMGNVINCYTDSDTLVGYRNTNYTTIENSYYLSAEETEDGGKTAAQFASGEVAFLLQAGQQPGYDYDEEGNEIEVPAAEIWGQTIGVDEFPVLGGQKVNYGYVSCHSDAEKVYTNTVAFSEKPDHSGEIEYSPNADGTTHSSVYSCCGEVVTENEAHTQPLTWVNLGEAGHISYYACCQRAEDVETVPHSYDEATLLCGCGEVSSDVAAIVIAGETVTGYTDAAEALKAATSGATVRLLKDATLTESVVAEYFLNLYLCGHTLTLADGVSLNAFCIIVDGSDGENSISGTVTGNTEGGMLLYPKKLENVTVTNAHEAGYAVLLDFRMYLEMPASGVALEGRLADVYLYDNHNHLSFPNGYQGDPISVAAYGPYCIAWCYPGGATVDWFISADENYVLWQEPGDTQRVYLRRNIVKQGIALSAAEIVQAGEIPTVTAAGLTLDEDYTVAYYRDGAETTDLNENRGVVTVVITGKGDYAGTLELTYEVVCGHFEEPVNVNQRENGHKVYCPGCQTAEDVETVPHSYDESTLLCSCGQVHPDAVVLVSMDGTPVRAFTDVEFAVNNAIAYTAEDKAVLKLLQNVDLGEGNMNLHSGVYTLDLNGFALTSSDPSSGVVCIYNDADLTICNGTIIGSNNCIQLVEGKLTVSDVTCQEANLGIMVYDGELIMRRCDIQTFDGMRVNSGSVTVYDSTFATDQDLDSREDGIITFCEGTEFPGGLSVDGVSLESLLPEGMAYWRGNTMIVMQEGATMIWGHVTVKAACTHEDSTTVYIPKDMDNHVISYSCCFSGSLEPHSLDAEGKCTICGFDPANSVIIRMTDSYGDGWSGNAIRIYEDGVLIDTTTVEEGSEAIWICAYNPEKEYEFCWVKGNYSNECSFELLFAGETVFTADRNDCNNYNDGYKFFPGCQHVYGEGVVTAPTCEDEGYTTYTCTLCGLSYTDNWQDSLGGHKKAEGDEGDVTAPTCISVGYTSYTCTVCGESYEDNLVDPLAHVLGEDGNCTVCGNLYSIPVYISGNHITSYNMADVLGDGTVSYDPTTNTLTLNGYRGSDIYMETSLNILLLGENTIETDNYGIFCYFHAGTVSISGTGSLDIISEYESVYMECSSVTLTIGGSATLNLMGAEEGISLFADTAELVIRDNATVIIGTEEVPMEEECIYVDGNITGSVTITDNASVTCVTADEEGIFVGGEHSYLTISGNANVYAAGDDEGLDAEFITISGGTVTAIGGAGDEGIYTRVLTVSGGTVTAEGEGQGIEAEEIIITGGTVTAIGGMIASVGDFMTPGTITLGEDMAITAPEGATLGELDMTDVEEGFVLAVLNPDGTLANTVIITKVESPIRIITQPGNCEGILGQSAVFTVEAEGEGFTYQWYYYDVGTATWLKSYSPGSTTDTVSPVFYAYRNGQQYRCVITDAEGNSVTSDAASMTLKASEAEITGASGDVEGGAIGRDYTFSVTVTGNNLSYRWEVSTDGGETWNLTWLTGYNTDTLTVKLNANRNGNLYRCVISGADGTSVTSEPMALHLQAESVQIVGQPENVKVLTGETATFTVVAEGSDLTYAWFRSDYNGTTWTKTYLPGFDTATLSFQANTDRVGKYLCYVSDGSGKVVATEVVTLSLDSEIVSQPENFICGAGQTAAFVVNAQGENLRYQWYYSADNGETWVRSYLPGFNTDTFFFQVNASRAAKLYKCVITDRHGEILETKAVSVTIG